MSSAEPPSPKNHIIYLMKKESKYWVWLTLKKTRERRFHPDLQDLARSREGKIVRQNRILRPYQKLMDQRHPFQLFRTKGNKPRTHFLFNRMAITWTYLQKDIAFAHSVDSFKSKLDLYLNKVCRNTHRIALDEAGDLISWQFITTAYSYYNYDY